VYRRTHSLSHLDWSEGRRPVGVVLHSSNEPGDLLQWLCHDDSTINIVLDIIIIIIIIIIINIMTTTATTTPVVRCLCATTHCWSCPTLAPAAASFTSATTMSLS